MSLFDFLGGGGGLSNEAKRNKQGMQSTRRNLSELINNLIKRGESNQEQPALTAQDLFGEAITRMGDSARSGANATKQALARSIMGGGGDISGAAGANMLGIDENLAREIGQQGLRFEGLAQGENRFRTQRADNLITRGMQGLQALFGLDQNLYMDQVQQDQARRQRGAGMFGNILQAGATVASAALCWVAEELYGEGSNEFHSIRGLLLSHEGVTPELDEFIQTYKEHGEEVAKQLKNDPVRRLKAEALFDELYEISQKV